MVQIPHQVHTLEKPRVDEECPQNAHRALFIIAKCLDHPSVLTEDWINWIYSTTKHYTAVKINELR